MGVMFVLLFFLAGGYNYFIFRSPVTVLDKCAIKPTIAHPEGFSELWKLKLRNAH
jgi:hypothetical protein